MLSRATPCRRELRVPHFFGNQPLETAQRETKVEKQRWRNKGGETKVEKQSGETKWRNKVEKQSGETKVSGTFSGEDKNLFRDLLQENRYTSLMGRPRRTADGGLIYHVLNRANAKMTIFEKDADYEAFHRILQEAKERMEMRLLAYCMMPNHWHLVLWPAEDRQLSQFTGWVTLTHTQRWHAHRRTTGSGHLYQGRFKSFPVEDDEHFYAVSRYVERNALRANLVRRAEQWRWCSLHRWKYGTAKERALLSSWPLARRPGWADYVNAPQTDGELAALRRSVQRGCPYGGESWSMRMIRKLGLESTIRRRGRPRKSGKGS